MIKMTSVILVATIVLAGCVTMGDPETGNMTIQLIDDTNHILEIPQSFRQEDHTPTEGINFYQRQAILYSELGSRFYNRGETGAAIDYFQTAIEYDQYNNRAHFALGLIYYEQGRFADALDHLGRVRRQSGQLFPYDINYYDASRMILSYFPFRAKVTALYQNEMAGSESDLIIINRGEVQGARIGMEFQVFRVGNPIRDVETLGVIGQQRTPIGRARIVRTEPNNSIARITSIEDNFFIQIDDLLETEYMQVREAEL
jgi:tetratricopeptide (TPR) repeat protein